MADQRLTDKSTLTEIDDNDLFHVVDVSDTSANAQGTSKKGLWSLIKSTLQGIFIPLSGTEVGSPVTGDIQLSAPALAGGARYRRRSAVFYFRADGEAAEAKTGAATTAGNRSALSGRSHRLTIR